MIEETAVRVEISAARFASQSIFDILRLTVQAMSRARPVYVEWSDMQLYVYAKFHRS